VVELTQEITYHTITVLYFAIFLAFSPKANRIKIKCTSAVFIFVQKKLFQYKFSWCFFGFDKSSSWENLHTSESQLLTPKRQKQRCPALSITLFPCLSG